MAPSAKHTTPRTMRPARCFTVPPRQSKDITGGRALPEAFAAGFCPLRLLNHKRHEEHEALHVVNFVSIVVQARRRVRAPDHEPANDNGTRPSFSSRPEPRTLRQSAMPSTPERYGRISKLLHWTVFLLMLNQF